MKIDRIKSLKIYYQCLIILRSWWSTAINQNGNNVQGPEIGSTHHQCQLCQLSVITLTLNTDLHCKCSCRSNQHQNQHFLTLEN